MIELLDGEMFSDIPGFINYMVSTHGRVLSFINNRIEILKPGLVGRGYCNCRLRENGEIKRAYVHRLVAEIFISNHDDKPQVNHINGIKTDNRVENLEWNTRSENIRHSFDNGFHKMNNEHNPMYGKKHSEECKQKQSQSKKGIKNPMAKFKITAPDGNIYYSEREVCRVYGLKRGSLKHHRRFKKELINKEDN